MPAPATVDELIDLVLKSGVSEEARLKGYVQKLTDQGTKPAEPGKLASQFVKDGILTFFQAEQLLQGKWKRFTIGKYKVLERLGSGGMGQVFLCEHKFMKRRVAVKVLPTAKADDPASLERFYREARAVAAVDHPNIVRAYDIDQDDNLHFLVMEWVDGTNLQDLVKKVGPLDVVRACHYMYGSAVGLQHAHEIGLVHRDIKPGNILVDRAGVVKILDMGLARFFHDEDDQLTKKYDENVLGTADYLAPEQALESHTVDIRADIYSLGATFYFLLTGSVLFPEGSVAQKLIWHQSRTPKPVKALRPDTPDEVVAVLARMMEKDADKRYQTPAEVMAALAPWVATPIPPPSDRELPVLSPAASGRAESQTGRATAAVSAIGMGGRSGPGSMAPTTVSGPNPATLSSSWEGRLVTPPPPASGSLLTPPAPPPAPAAGAMWEVLAADTQSEAPSKTDRPSGRLHVSSAKPSSATGQKAAPPRKKKGVPTWALISGAVAFAIGSLGLIYAIYPKTEPKPNPIPISGQPAHTPRTLVVRKAGGDGAFTSLRLAIEKAGPGDTIRIQDEQISEPAIRVLGRGRLKDLTIESELPGQKAAVIRFAADGGSLGAPVAMMEINDAENVAVRNVTFDGFNMAGYGVQVVGICPAVTLDRVGVTNVKIAAVQLRNARGEAARPILLTHVRLQLTGADYGLHVAAVDRTPTRHVIVRDARFEGGGKTGIQFDGPGEDIEMTRNRVFNVTRGIGFGKLPVEGTAIKARLTNTTFYGTKAGVSFDFQAAEVKGRYEFELSRNYFAKTEALAKLTSQNGSVPGFMPAGDNAKAKDSKEGNIPLKAIAVDNYDLPPRPNPEAADFLCYPSNAPLSRVVVGSNQVRVGYSLDATSP